MKLLFGADDEVIAWIVERVENNHGRGFGEARAVGVLNDDEQLVAGIVFFNWFPEAGTIEMGIAADTPKWATRRIIARLLSYAFDDCNCQRVTLVTGEDNADAIRLATGVGFKKEAVIVSGYGRNKNAVLLRLLDHEWRSGIYRVRHAVQGESSDTAVS